MEHLEQDARIRVGIDIGGTFTDCVIVSEGGHRLTTKSLTTPDDPAQGVIDCLEIAADHAATDLHGLLSRTVAFVHGTTVGTNALAQRRGARTGLLMTRGHEQTVTIGRVKQKITGLSEREKTHITHLAKADPPIVAREDIRAVTERIDSGGNVVVPLDLEQVERDVDALVADGIKALAVCLLWSFAHPEHEERIAALVRQKHPEIYLSVSSEVAPLIGEYERAVSTIFNSYIGPTVGDYLKRLEDLLSDFGMACPLLVMQTHGGLSTVDAVRNRPLLTVDSGPAGGVLGGRHFTDLIGEKNIVCADVGGTTFDVGLIFDNRVQFDPLPVIDRYAYLTPKIYVKSIGAGGGSIAWIDAGGTLRVGPHSAGAVPGPACYGRGGTSPTVTDAHIVLGYLDPDHPLGGTVALDKSAAESALASVAEPLGMSVEELAAGIAEISSAQMADLMRKVTVERGLDPRGFTVFAYGGAGPVFAPFIARQIGARTAYIPADSGMFSALGMLTTDLVFSEERTAVTSPPLSEAELTDLNELLDSLAAQAIARFSAEGLDASQVRLRRAVEMRFRLQVHQLEIDLPEHPVTPADIETLCETFIETYERTYGRNSAYPEAGIELVNFRVVGTLALERPDLTDRRKTGGEADSQIGTRQVHFGSSGGFTETAIHAGDRVRVGQEIAGPAIVQRFGDTVVVPPDTRIKVDEHGGLVVTIEDVPARETRSLESAS
ncbi:MAG: hydantoinase/oxoprolinase family protein [Alphaproteobacteria bacterium]|nr:hydantoinase/oxoprolinase family protein [Alphaproteobacteria bacterium]